MSDSNKKEKLHERFIRWDTVRRNYFSVIINLFLTISIGLLSFLLQELAKPNFTKSIFFTTALILIFASVILGVLTSTSRFFDFRYTARKIRLTEQKEEKNTSNNDIDRINRKKKCYETLTLILFYFQIGTFVISIISSVLSALSQHKDKLF